MTTDIIRRFLILLFVLISCIPASAQEAATATAAPSAPAAPSATATAASENAPDADSHMTRQQLHEVLRRLPPQVGRVLQLDPTLWTNPSYMSTYPELAGFVGSHPEVARSPQFFLEGAVHTPEFIPESPSVRMWRDLMEVISVFIVMVTIVGAATWLIKTFVEQRRWSRVSKTQYDVHSKLLDRFASNQDLLAYIETNAGKRFLESAPVPLSVEPKSRPLHAPVGRILWSVQGGLVILAFGLGLRFVSMSIEKELVGPMAALGAIVIAIGLGLLASAGAAYLLSRKMGLWQPPADPAIDQA